LSYGESGEQKVKTFGQKVKLVWKHFQKINENQKQTNLDEWENI